MAIDYVIDFGCEPKDVLTTSGILARLKGRDQIKQIIQMYREAGDNRPLHQMGFEYTRNTASGEEETQTVRVTEIQEAVEQLDPLAHHCEGCPANLTGDAFGCFGRINYPLSDNAERWLLLQLPLPHEAPLIWTMLGEHLRELNIHSEEVQDIRENGLFFESKLNPRRKLGDIALSGNNLFYLLFMQGHITPSRAGVTLLFFNIIPRNIDASDIFKLTPASNNALEAHPYQIKPDPETDDTTIRELKAFFYALYSAWRLNVNLLLDV